VAVLKLKFQIQFLLGIKPVVYFDLSLFSGMAPRKPSGSTSKKQKAVTSSSQGSQEIDGTKFTGPVQFQRYQVLETRKIWSERVFNIDPEGSFKKFAEIVDNRGWDKLINPPKKFNPSIVTDFMQMHTQLTMHHSPTLPWFAVAQSILTAMPSRITSEHSLPCHKMKSCVPFRNTKPEGIGTTLPSVIPSLDQIVILSAARPKSP
jgi:hypothetical protein